MKTADKIATETILLAKNLTTDFPRSPRDTLGGVIIGMRTLDKCRAMLANTIGEYHYNCPLDKLFLEFVGISAEEFSEKVAQGLTDAQMSEFVTEKLTGKTKEDIVQFNNKYRYMRLSELDIALQVYFEDYIPKYLPKNKVVYHWFDVYDIEEQRL